MADMMGKQPIQPVSNRRMCWSANWILNFNPPEAATVFASPQPREVEHQCSIRKSGRVTRRAPAF